MLRNSMLLFLTAAALLAASCQSFAEGNLPSSPPADLSTPENALQSYWKMRDWSNDVQRISITDNKSFSNSTFPKAMATVTTGEARSYWLHFHLADPPQTQRTIISTSWESPSRVVFVVNLKNISPIPDGVTPNAIEVELRQKGQNNRYVVERDDEGWKVSEAFIIGVPGLPARSYRMYEPQGQHYPCCVTLE